MARYVGKRIVPKHCGYWDNTKAYEMENIVYDRTSGNSYISCKAVPVGTDISQEEYWALCSDFNMQMDLLEKHFTATEQRIKTDNDETEQAIRQDNDATEAAILADNQATREHVDESLEKTTTDLTQKVTVAQTAMTQQKASFDATAQQLNTRMDAVLSAGTGTGETEILDARVDANGNTYASLGESIRRVDKFLSRVQKIPFVFKERSESDAIVGTGSTIVCTRLENRGVFSGMDVALTMNNQESHPAHWVRSYFHIPDQEFQEKYNGKRICIQIWSSAECNIYWAYGYWPAFNELYTVCEWQRLHPGYNEFIMDTGSDEYKSKEKYPGYDFYVNYLFGSYSGRPLMPDGEYNFRISLFMDEDLGYGLPGSTGAIESVFSAHSLLAKHSEEAGHATEAEHAVDADNAEKAVHAQDSRRVGAVTIVKDASMAQTPYLKFLTRDNETGKIDVRVTSEWGNASDCGLTIKIGTMEELRGSTIILYKEEVQPFSVIALNAGASWGNQTYGSVDFEPLYDNYWIADFDTLFDTLRHRTSHVPEDFDGTFYMMIFGNDQWQIPAEGEEFHNYYGVYQVAKDSFIYTPMMWSIKEAIDGLEERTDALEESVPTEQTIRDLRDRCSSLEASLEAVKTGNVLWGKKYFATGDSFTEGDFSGWTDEEGRSGRNSPVIYDSDWKMYKTYPWWIARRNNMTLINDGKCGSIMPLSKEYLNGDEGVTENNRLPFSLNRYKTIPADVDYITLWFGINDSGHTNLGTINDTTNETYYGAWNVVMEYLITNYPYAKIGIIITNNAATTYRQATREIAIKWGIPYLDMMGCDQVPVIFGRESELGLCSKANTLRRNAFLVGPSNGHPNLEAHKYQSTFVEDFLRRL